MLCVDAPRAADASSACHVGQHGLWSGGAAGRAHEYAEAGQEIWFRLEPGPHAFALVPENGFSATGGGAR